MDCRQRAHQLVCEHEDRLQAKLPVAKVEEVLQARSQEVNDHDVVVPLNTIPPDVRNADCAQRGVEETGVTQCPAFRAAKRGRYLPPPWRILYSFDSYSSCAWRVLTDSCASEDRTQHVHEPVASVGGPLGHEWKSSSLGSWSTYQLNGHLLPGLDIGAQVNVAEGPASNFAPQAIAP